MPKVIDLAAACGGLDQAWSPRIAGQVNDMHVKVARLEGAFEWHQHEREDELFLVLRGVLLMHFRARTDRVEEGQFIIVPRGTEHLPETETPSVDVLLFEPASTVNTGDGPDGERTRRDLRWVEGAEPLPDVSRTR